MWTVVLMNRILFMREFDVERSAGFTLGERGDALLRVRNAACVLATSARARARCRNGKRAIANQRTSEMYGQFRPGTAPLNATTPGREVEDVAAVCVEAVRSAFPKLASFTVITRYVHGGTPPRARTTR